MDMNEHTHIYIWQGKIPWTRKARIHGCTKDRWKGDVAAESTDREDCVLGRWISNTDQWLEGDMGGVMVGHKTQWTQVNGRAAPEDIRHRIETSGSNGSNEFHCPTIAQTLT